MNEEYYFVCGGGFAIEFSHKFLKMRERHKSRIVCNS